jgi:hypothetical protein
VITEVAHLVASRLGAEAEVRFLGDLAAGSFLVEPVAPADWLRIAELVGRHRDLPLGTVDASVVAAAERLGIVELATVDRRHFSVVRPRHTTALTLLPSPAAPGSGASQPYLDSDRAISGIGVEQEPVAPPDRRDRP